MAAFISPFSPSFEQLGGLTAVILVACAFVAIGSLVSGRPRVAEAGLIYGWAVVMAFFTVFGLVGTPGFTALAVVLGLIALVALVMVARREGRFGPPGMLRLFTLGLPLLVLVASMTATQWDELTTWLPNARYLIEHDTFPRSDLPATPSVFPAYPHALPLVVFLASRIAGFLVENGGAVFNLLLYLSFGLFVARLVATVVRDGGPAPWEPAALPMGWGLCAFAGLLATALNPTYVSRLVLSIYADAPTAIAIGFAVALTWFMLNALSEGSDEKARSFAWQAGLALTAAIGLKQVNLVLLIALVLAVALVVFRDPVIRWSAVGRLVPHVLFLPLAVYGLWRLYVGIHITGGEFSFRPLDGWFIAEIPDIVARMALVASKKGGYFGIMTVAVVMALRIFWQPRSAYHRLVVLTAVMFLAYNGFLLLSYVAAFDLVDALRAGSYWRYNTHLGGVCLLFAAYSLCLLWRRYVTRPVPQTISAIAVLLVLAMPIAMAKKLRFDLDPRYGYARATAIDMAKHLAPTDRLLLVDPDDDGQYLVIMRYWMHGSATIAGEINAWNKPTVAKVVATAKVARASHIWVYGGGPIVDKAFNVSLGTGHSHLLARRSSRWVPIARWPHKESVPR